MGETQPKSQSDKVVVQGEESLYKIDVNGRAHKPGGSGAQSGSFMKEAHREPIDAHEDQIRDGMDVQAEAYKAYKNALESGLGENAAHEAAQAVYDAHEAAKAAQDSTGELADAIERGEVTGRESAEKIAELTTQLEQVTNERDTLTAKVESLEAEIAALNARLTEVLARLDQMAGSAPQAGGEALTDEQMLETGDSILKRLGHETDHEGSEGAFTKDDQQELRKKLDDEAGDDGTDSERQPSKELVKIDRNVPLANIRAELADSEHAERYKTALSKYAELKAQSETGGRWGRKGREKELLDAESELLQAKVAFEQEVFTLAEERGLYPGAEEQAKQRVADDMFNAIRGLDIETRQAVNDIHDRNKENRNVFTKATAAVGRWLTSGGKVAQWAKAGGSGLVAGFGVGMSGVGIPITTAIGVGLGLGVRGAATVANLDSIRAQENKDAQGNAKAAVSDEEFRRFIRESADTGSRAEQAQALAQRILEKSRARGYEQANRARSNAAKTMGKFGLGFTAGMFTGNYLHDAMNTAHASGDAGVDQSDIDHNGSEGSNEIDFPKGADRISSGEGWYSQFNDMGMSHKEARAMFRDTGLMNKLVDMGVAYVDHSTRIGGYGINMPSGGRLPAAAMQLIGEAMKAKGF